MGQTQLDIIILRYSSEKSLLFFFIWSVTNSDQVKITLSQFSEFPRSGNIYLFNE